MLEHAKKKINIQVDIAITRLFAVSEVILVNVMLPFKECFLSVTRFLSFKLLLPLLTVLYSFQLEPPFPSSLLGGGGQPVLQYKASITGSY